MTRAPQFKPLPENERGINLRLSAVRRFEGLSQDQLAKKVGVTRNQIANIESLRVPLRAGLALSICAAIKVNPRWLAEGVGATKLLDGSLLGPVTECDSPRTLFSTFYARRLGPVFLELESYWEAESEKLKVSALSVFEKIKRGEFRKTPEALDALERVTDLFLSLKASATASRKTTEEVNRIVSNSLVLTEASSPFKNADVESPLENLRERLKRIIALPGKRAELIDFLGAPAESVSRWLSGAREPGGEVALKMLHWVERQERK